MFALQMNVLKTPSLRVPALNYHLVVWMKTLWRDWEPEIKQCYQCHARCFLLAGWTKWVRSHYHFLRLNMLVPTPCQQCAAQLCLKVESGPLLTPWMPISVATVPPSVLFKTISLIYGLQSFLIALRPQNRTKDEQFSPHSWPAHSWKEADNHIQYGDVVQAQMQVIKGSPAATNAISKCTYVSKTHWLENGGAI